MNKFEKLQRLLTELKEEKAVKIVEGNKDKKALERLGIKNIITLQGKPVQDKIKELKHKAIILTDYDRKGRELEKRLKEALISQGIIPNLEYKKELKKLTGITQIEELFQKYEKMKEEAQRC